MSGADVAKTQRGWARLPKEMKLNVIKLATIKDKPILLNFAPAPQSPDDSEGESDSGDDPYTMENQLRNVSDHISEKARNDLFPAKWADFVYPNALCKGFPGREVEAKIGKWFHEENEFVCILFDQERDNWGDDVEDLPSFAVHNVLRDMKQLRKQVMRLDKELKSLGDKNEKSVTIKHFKLKIHNGPRNAMINLASLIQLVGVFNDLGISIDDSTIEVYRYRSFAPEGIYPYVDPDEVEFLLLKAIETGAEWAGRDNTKKVNRPAFNSGYYDYFDDGEVYSLFGGSEDGDDGEIDEDFEEIFEELFGEGFGEESL